jgi:hypothetical protein
MAFAVDSTELLADSGVLTLNEEQWRGARHRAEVIGPLADSAAISREAAEGRRP